MAKVIQRIIVITCAVIGLVQTAYCQPFPVYGHHSQFLTSGGLPNGYILALTQDRDGFLWVATADGLARYDGKNFQRLSQSETDSLSLRFNNVHDLVLVNDEIWIFYYNGQTATLDPRTFAVTHFSKTADDFDFVVEAFRNLQQDANANLPKLKKMYREHLKDNGPVYGLATTNDNNICILTKDGFEISNDNSWTNFRSVELPKSNSSEYHHQLFKQPDGQIVLIDRKGVLRFNPANMSFTRIENPVPFRDDEDLFVRACQDNSGRLVYSSKGYVFLLDGGEMISLWKLPESDFGVITSIYVDRTNTLWIGTNGYGLYSVNLSTPSIKSYSYNVNFINDLLLREFNIPFENIPAIWKINHERQRWLRSFYDHDGRLYISNHGGVRGKGPFVFRLEGKKFVPLPSRIERSIIGLKKTPSGVWALNQEGEFLHWADENSEPELLQIPGLYDLQNSPGLFDLEADDNFFWTSSKYNGLFQLSGNKVIDKFTPGTAHNGGIPNFEISDIVNDPVDNNVLWIGTLGGGLVKWDKNQKASLKVYTSNDGLSNNSVGGIIPDRNGNLWITTNQGLSVLDRATNKFRIYTASDGLFSDEFHRFMYFKLPDSRIAVGGLGGYSVFDPLTFLPDTLTPDVQLILKEFSGNLNTLQELDLSYDENTIDFDVAVMQFNNPRKNHFRYKLLNYEDQWVDLGNDQHIRLSKLPYGRYTLVVGASNTSGIWSPNEKRLVINIHPPWYLTWWAYVTYFILVVSIISLVWRSFKRDLQRKHEVDLQRHEAMRLKQLDEIKTRFFSNITHEFRTPLTLILAPLEKAIHDGESLPPSIEKLLSRNHAHATQLLKLVNQLLDISKLESGKMVIGETMGDLAGFLRQCVESFRDQAESKGLQFSFIGKDIEGHFLFDHSNLEKIISNLVSNAIKFTSKGKVEVSVSYDDKVWIRVSDTGVGIDKHLHEKVFERFYQVEDLSTSKHQGTGIGLSLVKELLELMNGRIIVSSEPGKGTSMIVELPIRRAIDVQQEKLRNNNSNVDEPSIEEKELPILLIAEDNEELRQFLVESLSGEWLCLQAADGNTAWDIIQQSLPDIVISDVMMPGMNGVELCRAAKSTPLTNHINFIMLTAKASQPAKEEGLSAGADDYITKPFHPHELVLRIRNLLLQQKRLREHLLEQLSPPGSTQVPKIKDEFLASVYDVISSNLDKPELGADMIANTLAVSKRTLNRKLSAVINLSVTDIIKKLRVQKSVELIRSGYRMSEIAYAVGFESPSYFARCFKEEYKKTPSEFAREIN